MEVISFYSLSHSAIECVIFNSANRNLVFDFIAKTVMYDGALIRKAIQNLEF
jgi:hypothetical protein